MELPLNRAIGSRMRADLESADDYRRHRKRVGRELLALKKELLLVTKDTRNFLSHDKTKNVTKEDFDRDERYGTVFLLMAERDYLYAMEIRAKLEVANAGASSYMKLMRTRLKRAICNFKRILDIFGSLSDLKKLEYYIYGALLQGLYAIIRKHWSVAINLYSIARCCLDLLLDNLSESADAFDSTILTDLLENTVIPSTKFAVIQEGLKSALVDLTALSRERCHDNLVPYLVPAIEIIDENYTGFTSYVEVDLTRSVNWRGHEAVLYNDELARKIMTIKEMSHDDMDQVSDAWSTALDLFTSSENQDDDDIEKVQNNAIVKTYINYNQLFARLKNTNNLLNDYSDTFTNGSGLRQAKCTFQIKVLSDMIAIVEQVKELPGVYNDEELYASLELLVKYFSAKKLLFHGQYFEVRREFKKALKLYNLINKQLDLKADNLKAIDSLPYPVVSESTFKAFIARMQQKLHDTHIGAYLQHEAEPPVKTTIVENINSYSDNRDSFDFISLRPILSKPVLFDIAFNYINYSQTGTKSAIVTPKATNEASVAGDEKKRGGSSFFGIFGGRN